MNSLNFPYHENVGTFERNRQKYEFFVGRCNQSQIQIREFFGLFISIFASNPEKKKLYWVVSFIILLLFHFVRVRSFECLWLHTEMD